MGDKMLWSIVPEDVVFEHWQDDFIITEKPYKNGFLRVRAGENGYGSIERIISTDPKDYLNAALITGMKVRL